MVEYLLELLLGPGRGALAAQAVQDQQRGVSDLVEQIAIGNVAGWGEAGPQVVQEVRDVDEKDYGAFVDAAAGSSSQAPTDRARPTWLPP